MLIAWLPGRAQLKDEYWQRIPDNQKTEFTVHGWGDRVMYIQCFISTLENWQLSWGEEWAEKKATFEVLIAHMEEVLFPEQDVLFVAVANGSKSQYFWPTELVFTQGTRQYNISYSHILPLEDGPFAGGEMKPYVTIFGFVAIPKRIDITKPFKVWYGDDFGVIDPTTH